MIAIVFVVDQRRHRVDVDERRLRVDRRPPAARCRAGGTPCRTPGARSRASRSSAGRCRAAASPARGTRAPRAGCCRCRRGDEPAGSLSADRVGVQQVERHGDDLALELRHARAHVALQRVHVREQLEGAAHEVVVLVVAAVHRPGALAGLPRRVLVAARSSASSCEDRRAATVPSDGMPADDVVGLGVGIGSYSCCRASLIGRSAAYAASNWTWRSA